MKSIRRFLVIVLIAIITLANFIAALRGYLGSMDEAEQLFNERLLQQANLLNYALPALLPHTENQADVLLLPARHSDELSALEFQWISNSEKLLAISDGMPNYIVAPLREGFSSVNFEGYRWQVLITEASDKKSWFIIAERDDQRFRLAESMILQAVYPMVMAIPLIGFIIWLVLAFGLKPIAALARELHTREATDLHAIEHQSMPIELTPLVNSANELLRRLEASFEREKRFSGDAAHELRTPIAAMKIHCDNLIQSLSSPPVSAYKLQEGIQRMSYLVEQILILNRMAPDHFMGQFEPVNLTRLVKQVISDNSAALEHKKHFIEFNGEDSWIIGDRLALEALINNLLGNAIKYTPSGGAIAVNTWLRGKKIVLEVMDNGPGIPAEQRERVFDRFYRVDGDRHNSQVAGCGLGLSIVKQIVDLHQAKINLTQSRYAQGLLVMITFNACSDLENDLESESFSAKHQIQSSSGEERNYEKD